MRDIMRSLLSANLTITGIIMFIGSLITFFGSTFLINATNLGKRLGFLVVGAGTFGWCIINSILFVLYAPRGPKPAEIEGLNAFVFNSKLHPVSAKAHSRLPAPAG